MPRRWSRKPLTYRDALALLGAEDNRAVAIAGKLAGLGIAAVNVKTVGALAFFELRDEMVEWGDSVASSLRDRVKGLSRLDRTDRIVAAHAVIVITSFYEALRSEYGDLIAEARLTAEEQVAITTDTAVRLSYRELVKTLIDEDLPMPTPTRPFERHVDHVLSYYGGLWSRVRKFFEGLAAFEGRRFGRRITAAVLARKAVSIYTATFRRLAADVPEFAMWASMIDAQATRHAVETLGADLRNRLGELAVGLAGVHEVLAQTSSNSTPDKCRDDLSAHYRRYLDKPVLDSREVPRGVVLPTLGSLYVNPACRIAADAAFVQAELAVEGWWLEAPVVPDIQALLLGHLMSPAATTAPLVVLGQPGSGKSVLTRLLAASLPAADFLPVRVELRAVHADADIQDQIRDAVYLATDRHVDWPDLVEGAQGALPVVILDGFDELLQATGMNQSDYLERARNFQERQADLGRPVAIIVTSRTAVADRARFPHGSVAIRLEPFDKPRIRRWLDIWADANAEILASRNLRPLPAEAVQVHRELAGEPLLLLMLALYDADANALQREVSALNRAELYERLMLDFALREIRKHEPALSDDQEHRAVERELRQLGVAALAMFNRGRQIVNEHELNTDLAELIPSDPFSTGAATSGTAHRPLTAAETVVGRFFFVHEPTARRDTGPAERSFEFLHATFGEFLVARLVVQAVLDLVSEREYQSQRPNPALLNPGFLHAATSFELLSSRAPIIEFCTGLFAMHEGSRRSASRSLLIELLRDALYPHPHWQHSSYQPVSAPATVRGAAFSANLVLLAVVAEDTPVCVYNLLSCDQEKLFFDSWRSLAWLWQSQLTEWRTLISALRAKWVTSPPDRGARLMISAEDGSLVLLSESFGADDQVLTFAKEFLVGRFKGPFYDFEAPPESVPGRQLREATFFARQSHLESHIPLWRHPGDYTHSFLLRHAPQRLLLELIFAHPTSLTAKQRSRTYKALMNETPEPVQEAALRLLRNDIRHMPPADAEEIIRMSLIYAYPSDVALEVLAECALVFGSDILAGNNPSLSFWHWYVETTPENQERVQAAFARARVPDPIYPRLPDQSSDIDAESEPE